VNRFGLISTAAIFRAIAFFCFNVALRIADAFLRLALAFFNCLAWEAAFFFMISTVLFTIAFVLFFAIDIDLLPD